MADPFASMASAVLGILGVAATVQRGSGPVVPVRVGVRDELDQFADMGRSVSQVRHVEFDRAVWAPRRGDLVTISGVTRSIEAIAKDDGYTVEVILDA